MSSQASTTPARDGDNPYAAPSTRIDRYAVGWNGEDPEAESVRREHVASESYIKAIGISHYILVPLLSLYALYLVTILILERAQVVSAPWVYKPFWIIQMVFHTVAAVLAIVVGRGLRRLRRWAPGVLLLMTFLLLGYFGSAMTEEFSNGKFGQAMVPLGSMVFYVVAVNYIWAPGYGVVFTPEYGEMIARTPNIRVRARLPVRIKLYLGLVILLTIVLGRALSGLS